MLSTERCGLIALGETNGRLRLGLAALVVDRLAVARSAHRAGLEHPEEPLCPRITIGCSTARTVLRWSREAAAESAGGSSLKLTQAAAVDEPLPSRSRDVGFQWVNFWGSNHQTEITGPRSGSSLPSVRFWERLRPGRVEPSDLILDPTYHLGRPQLDVGADLSLQGISRRSPAASRRR